MTLIAVALAANRLSGLYQTNSLTFSGADQPVWTRVGGALAIRQIAWDRTAPWRVQACLAETLTDVYVRAPAVYGANWTLVLTAANIQALIGNYSAGQIRWVEYNSYLPGHVYVAWQYDLTLGGLYCIRSDDYGASWTAHVIYAGLFNYGIDCIEAGRRDSVVGTYGDGGVIYATCRIGIGAPPQTWRSFNDGLAWSVGDSDTGASNEQKLIKVCPVDLATTYTDRMPGAGVHNLAEAPDYAVTYTDIDGGLNVGLTRNGSAIWIKPTNCDVITVYRDGWWYCTSDGGAIWTSNAQPFATLAVDGAAQDKVLFGRYVPSIDPGVHLVYTTTDCGATTWDKSGANANLVDGGGDSVPYQGGIAQQGVIVYAYSSNISDDGGTNMANMDDFFDADMGVAWVQIDGPNTQPTPLLCANTDGWDEPGGDSTSRVCRTGTRGFQVTHTSTGLPGDPTISLETYLGAQRSYLFELWRTRCRFPLYLHFSKCGRADIFLNYEYGELGQMAHITNRSGGASSRGHADSGDGAPDATMKTWDITAQPLILNYWKLAEITRSVAEAEPLRSIAFCNSEQCYGPCGAAEGPCHDGVIVPDATGAARADVWYSANGFLTGAAAAGALNFAVSIDVASVTCFDISRDVSRVIVARGTTEADDEPLNYSDDGGATWLEISVGANGSFAAGARALFSLDQYHIWYGTDLGAIHFSNDAGATWTQQTSPIAEDIFAFSFCDGNYGMVVGGTLGATGVGARTVDGGNSWEAFATPLAGSAASTCVSVIDSQHAWITTEDGHLYYTNDFGDNWTERVLPRTATALGGVQFIDRYVGAVCGNYNDGVSDFGIVYRTFDGGYSWESYINNTAFDGVLEYFGMNALWVCNVNRIYAVGEPVDSVGLIMQLEANGPS